MLYPVLGSQVFRNYIFIRNGDLFALVWHSANWGKKKKKYLERQRGFIPEHTAEKRLFPWPSDISISLPRHAALMALCSSHFFLFFAALPCKRLHFSSCGSGAAIFNLDRLAAHLALLNLGRCRGRQGCAAPPAGLSSVDFPTRFWSMSWGVTLTVTPFSLGENKSGPCKSPKVFSRSRCLLIMWEST